MNPYLDVHLDSLPPPSRFRRPWSPDPYDPLPTVTAPATTNRREASDVSVEALDLADYSRTLRQQQQQPYAAFYPPQSRPLAGTGRLSDGIPSTPSLAASPSTSAPTSSSSRYPARRPFSLPSHSSRHSHSRLPYNYNYNSNSPQHQNVNPRYSPQTNPSSVEIDISQFPPWSRSWYYNAKHTTKSPPGDDAYDLPDLPHRRDPFDPSYTPSNSSYGPNRIYTPPHSLDHESSRDLLPWSGDPPSYEAPVDDALKEERIRMLEREFGDKPKRAKDKGKGKAKMDSAFLDDEGNPIVGTVDAKGNLVTQGPKKRTATRALQVILALGASIPSIYAALVIKPDPPAPPANRPPAFVLYIISVITTLLLLYLFVFHPCCCARRRKPPGPNPGMTTPGMMVLPVTSLPGGKGKKDKQKRKGGKGGKKGHPPPGNTDVQVNLIVDPHAFGGPDVSSSEEEEEEDYNARDSNDFDFPGGYDSQRRGDRARAKAKRAKRRSVFAGLAMEEQWKHARSWMKRLAIIDGVLLVVWGAVFIFIMTGRRCPSGAFGGWCDAYNVSSAAACLLSGAFGVSTFFNVKDLSASKVSPRTRM